ncbi:MAG: protein phosphatase 2C domain-containing protein [Chloroflexota bacterium]
MGNLTLQPAFRCETGAVRSRNEDSCLIFAANAGGHMHAEPMGLFVVADGMGGHVEGHVASSEAARVFAAFIISQVYQPLLDRRPIPADETLLELLESGVLAAHDAVYHPEPEHNGGTTLTAVLLLNHQAFIAHVGDTRAYLLDGNGLQQLTTDHSLVHKLQETGRLSPDQVEQYQYRNVLLQALGQEVALDIETIVIELPAAGKLLLCSDGLSGYVSEPRIQALLEEAPSSQQAADSLFEAAMAAGGIDNITTIVVDFTA